MSTATFSQNSLLVEEAFRILLVKFKGEKERIISLMEEFVNADNKKIGEDPFKKYQRRSLGTVRVGVELKRSPMQWLRILQEEVPNLPSLLLQF